MEVPRVRLAAGWSLRLVCTSSAVGNIRTKQPASLYFSVYIESQAVCGALPPPAVQIVVDDKVIRTQSLYHRQHLLFDQNISFHATFLAISLK